jgi:hypothetical protein
MIGLENTGSYVNEKTVIPYEDRVDINDIYIDRAAPIAERVEQYMKDIKNPCAFRCGKLAVNVVYSQGSLTLEQALRNYLISAANKS